MYNDYNHYTSKCIVMPDTADFYSSGFVIDIDLLASVRWYLMQFIIATTLHLYGQSYSGYINGY